MRKPVSVLALKIVSGENQCNKRTDGSQRDGNMSTIKLVSDSNTEARIIRMRMVAAIKSRIPKLIFVNHFNGNTRWYFIGGSNLINFEPVTLRRSLTVAPQEQAVKSSICFPDSHGLYWPFFCIYQICNVL